MTSAVINGASSVTRSSVFFEPATSTWSMPTGSGAGASGAFAFGSGFFAGRVTNTMRTTCPL